MTAITNQDVVAQSRVFYRSVSHDISVASDEDAQRVSEMMAEGGGVLGAPVDSPQTPVRQSPTGDTSNADSAGARIYQLFEESRAQLSSQATDLREKTGLAYRVWIESTAKRWAKMSLELLKERRGRVTQTMRQVPVNMHRVANQTQLVLELIDDFQTGTYRKIPWTSIAMLAFALLYAVSPADAIPDVIPIIGQLDDLSIIALATRATNKDLRAYCAFKGYDADEYFRPLAA